MGIFKEKHDESGTKATTENRVAIFGSVLLGICGYVGFSQIVLDGSVLLGHVLFFQIGLDIG